MNCKTAVEMKFGEVVIPSGTRCEIVSNIPKIDGKLDRSGKVNIVVDSYFININNIQNELDNNAGTYLTGYSISTILESLYLNALDHEVADDAITMEQLINIFGVDTVPKCLVKVKKVTLSDVIYYIEKEFSSWIEDNCNFRILSKEDVVDGEFSSFETGDKILSAEGVEVFMLKKHEYQKKLEKIGYTYEFKGGLIFE